MNNVSLACGPRRSLFGPLVVVGIGVIFLLRNLGVISYHTLGWWFARYWPALLIFWGLIKLIEYLEAKRSGRPAPGIGAGGVVFLIFLVMSGWAATRASRVNWQAIE